MSHMAYKVFCFQVSIYRHWGFRRHLSKLFPLNTPFTGSLPIGHFRPRAELVQNMKRHINDQLWFSVVCKLRLDCLMWSSQT